MNDVTWKWPLHRTQPLQSTRFLCIYSHPAAPRSATQRPQTLVYIYHRNGSSSKMAATSHNPTRLPTTSPPASQTSIAVLTSRKQELWIARSKRIQHSPDWKTCENKERKKHIMVAVEDVHFGGARPEFSTRFLFLAGRWTCVQSPWSKISACGLFLRPVDYLCT